MNFSHGHAEDLRLLTSSNWITSDNTGLQDTLASVLRESCLFKELFLEVTLAEGATVTLVSHGGGSILAVSTGSTNWSSIVIEIRSSPKGAFSASSQAPFLQKLRALRRCLASLRMAAEHGLI